MYGKPIKRKITKKCNNDKELYHKENDDESKVCMVDIEFKRIKMGFESLSKNQVLNKSSDASIKLKKKVKDLDYTKRQKTINDDYKFKEEKQTDKTKLLDHKLILHSNKKELLFFDKKDLNKSLEKIKEHIYHSIDIDPFENKSNTFCLNKHQNIDKKNNFKRQANFNENNLNNLRTKIDRSYIKINDKQNFRHNKRESEINDDFNKNHKIIKKSNENEQQLNRINFSSKTLVLKNIKSYNSLPIMNLQNKNAFMNGNICKNFSNQFVLNYKLESDIHRKTKNCKIINHNVDLKTSKSDEVTLLKNDKDIRLNKKDYFIRNQTINDTQQINGISNRDIYGKYILDFICKNNNFTSKYYFNRFPGTINRLYTNINTNNYFINKNYLFNELKDKNNTGINSNIERSSSDKFKNLNVQTTNNKFRDLTETEKELLYKEFLKRKYRCTKANIRYLAKDLNLPRKKSIDFLLNKIKNKKQEIKEGIQNLYKKAEKAAKEIEKVQELYNLVFGKKK